MIIYSVFLDMCKKVQEVIPWAKIRKNGKFKIVCLGHGGNLAYGKNRIFTVSGWPATGKTRNYALISEIYQKLRKTRDGMMSILDTQ